MSVNRSGLRAVALAIVLLVLAVSGSIAYPRWVRSEDLRAQAVAEFGGLDAPRDWGPASLEKADATDWRHRSLAWRWSSRTDPGAVPEVVSLAAEQGWRARNCGSETCVEKGAFLMQVHSVPCGAGARCGLVVEVSWTEPLVAWRLLGVCVSVIVGGLVVFLVVTRSRPRHDVPGRAGGGAGGVVGS
ncbi:hypothetical protein AB0M43_23760 [Longispora sp. NPDC051575]|uniref:hypothetical protein n=1 Tax=Longispora sp. NPDC051575 TaxID=3154943 RepID=UPI00343B2B17